MLPIVMMGSMTGVPVNIMFPGLLLSMCLTVVLIFLCIQSGLKARQIYLKENFKMAQRQKEKSKKQSSMGDKNEEQQKGNLMAEEINASI